jgi:hypothetical protein
MNTPTLNTSNPQAITFQYEQLTFTILGGIRLNGLDSLRVTIKVEFKSYAIRHNLDLYNDSQVEKLIRKCAERFEIGTVYIGKAIGMLINELENYRLKQVEALSLKAEIKKPLSEKDKQTAIQNLEDKNLLEQTIQDLQQSGIIGESENALILLLAMTSRKMTDPISVICLARSGTGKSYLMERVALCLPDEDKREHTQFTSNAFYYYEREEIRNKIFLIEDLAGALNSLFPIRELQSKRRISKTITQKGRDGKLCTITLIVEGPVCVIACTTQESIYEDNANRSVLIYLDDSREQDERIMHYQKQLRAGLIDAYKEQQIQTKLQQMQKVLEPIKVINPYAPIIDLPENFPKKRRALPIVLNFIEAITFYYQRQREQQADKNTGEIYIETHPSDVEWGFKLLKNVLLKRSDELSGAVRDFYETLKTLTEKNKLKKFKVSDIRKQIKMPPRTIQHYLKILLEYEYLNITAGKQRTGYEYELLSATSRNQLQDNLDEHIKKVMDNIWKAYNKKKKK